MDQNRERLKDTHEGYAQDERFDGLYECCMDDTVKTDSKVQTLAGGSQCKPVHLFR